MALTAKKKAFALAKQQGADNRQAAILAGYSVDTASAAGSRLSKDPDVVNYLQSVKTGNPAVKTTGQKNTTLADVKNLADPLEFLVSIFSDPNEEPKLRVDAAKAALPYFHGKVAEKGKKETKAEEAKQATKSGKFGTLSSQLMN